MGKTVSKNAQATTKAPGLMAASVKIAKKALIATFTGAAIGALGGVFMTSSDNTVQDTDILDNPDQISIVTIDNNRHYTAIVKNGNLELYGDNNGDKFHTYENRLAGAYEYLDTVTSALAYPSNIKLSFARAVKLSTPVTWDSAPSDHSNIGRVMEIEPSMNSNLGTQLEDARKFWALARDKLDNGEYGIVSDTPLQNRYLPLSKTIANGVENISYGAIGGGAFGLFGLGVIGGMIGSRRHKKTAPTL